MRGQDENEQQLKNFSQDATRTRVRLLAEGVAKMVSAVLLALALSKVDLKREGSGLEQKAISPIAAITMAFSVLLMALLWPCLSKLVAGLKWLSNLLVLLCALLLMWLASDVLLLIGMKKNHKMAKQLLVSVSALAFVLISWFVYFLWRGIKVRDRKALVQRCEKDLENTVDFCAAFTVVLFLGLERLALEVQQPNHCKEKRCHNLENSLLVSFITCVLGVAVMFFWTVVPLPVRRIPIHMNRVIEASNIVLAVFIAVTVAWISAAALQFYAILLAVLPLVALLLFCYLLMPQQKQHQNRNSEDNPVIIDIHQEEEPGDQQQHPMQGLVQNSPEEPHVINTTRSQDLDEQLIDEIERQQLIDETESQQQTDEIESQRLDENNTDAEKDMSQPPPEDQQLIDEIKSRKLDEHSEDTEKDMLHFPPEDQQQTDEIERQELDENKTDTGQDMSKSPPEDQQLTDEIKNRKLDQHSEDTEQDMLHSRPEDQQPTDEIESQQHDENNTDAEQDMLKSPPEDQQLIDEIESHQLYEHSKDTEQHFLKYPPEVQHLTDEIESQQFDEHNTDTEQDMLKSPAEDQQLIDEIKRHLDDKSIATGQDMIIPSPKDQQLIDEIDCQQVDEHSKDTELDMLHSPPEDQQLIDEIESQQLVDKHNTDTEQDMSKSPPEDKQIIDKNESLQLDEHSKDTEQDMLHYPPDDQQLIDEIESRQLDENSLDTEQDMLHSPPEDQQLIDEIESQPLDEHSVDTEQDMLHSPREDQQLTDEIESQHLDENNTDTEQADKPPSLELNEQSWGSQLPLANDDTEDKPPSLELTKLALLGFLAVSIPSISNCSLSNWAIAFILLTASSIHWALTWRLLAHGIDTSPARSRAATIACILTNASAIGALIPFTVMAASNASSWCSPYST